MLFASAIALLIGFRANGSYSRAFLLAAMIPVLPALFDRAYRGRLISALKIRWERLKAYEPARDAIPVTTTLLFVVLPSAVLYIANGKTIGAGDTRPVMPSAVSVVTDGDYRLDEFCREGSRRKMFDADAPSGFFLRREGAHVYSSYPVGMTVFATPVAAMARVAGANFDKPMTMIRLEKIAAVAVAAIGIGLFFLVAIQVAPVVPSLVTTGMLATGSVMFTTVGQGLWQHGGLVIWSLLAMLVEFRSRPRWSLRSALLEGFACGMMPACRLSSATFLIPFGIWMLWRSPKRAVFVVGTALVTAMPFALLYFSIYGSLAGPSTPQLRGVAWNWSVLWPLFGVLFSPARGLFVYQPWIVLVVISFFWVGAKKIDRGPEGWKTFCLAAIGFQLLLNACWMNWWGGWCWGSRLLAEVVPLCALLALPVVAALWESRRGRGIVLSLGILAILMHAPCAFFRANDWNHVVDIDQNTQWLWSWSHAPFLQPFQS